MAKRGRKPIDRSKAAARGVQSTAHPCEAPKPPRNLKGEALREWRRVIPLLVDAGGIAQVDRAALTIYCEQWALYRDAADAAQQVPMTVTTPQGTYAHPLLKVAEAARISWLQLAKELGLTPASRARMRKNARTSAAKDEAEPDIGDFVNQNLKVAT